jgi:hypothetical protein
VFNNHLAIFAGQLTQNQLAAAQQAHFLEIMGQFNFPFMGDHPGAAGAFLPGLSLARFGSQRNPTTLTKLLSSLSSLLLSPFIRRYLRLII